jgi:hypothetical protein
MGDMGLALVFVLLDLTVEPAPLPVELRDNVVREWAADRDFELTASWRGLAIVINHHVIDRNFDDAQVIATYSIEL